MSRAPLRRPADQRVLIRPPSMVKSAPVTLPARAPARNSDEVRHLSGVVKRPVAASAAALLGDGVGGAPPAFGTVCGHAVRRRATAPSSRDRAHRVDPDAVLRHFLGQRLGEVRHGRLGRAVVEDRRVGEEGVDRARRSRCTAPGGDHRWQYGAGHPHGRHEVEGQGAQPVVVGDAGSRRRGMRSTDVVDQDVDRAVGDRRRGEVGRGERARSGEADTTDPAPRRHEGSARESCVPRRRRGRLPRPGPAYRQSDAMAGTGHNRQLAFESELHGRFLRSGVSAGKEAAEPRSDPHVPKRAAETERRPEH